MSIGEVFTPLYWGRYFINLFGIFDEWLNGKTIFDPTMGEGSLLQSFIEEALSLGISLSKLPVKNLYGVEKDRIYHKNALEKFYSLYKIRMDNNFVLNDIFNIGSRQYDIIFSNPPWSNFNEYPDEYKEMLKPVFFKYGLIDNSKSLLLGNSRIDISSLIIQKCLYDNLRTGGKGIFIVPLSIIHNPGANDCFRKFECKGVKFKLEVIYSLTSLNIFDKVNTHYGIISITKGEDTIYPIPYYIYNNDWTKYHARPIRKNGDAFLVGNDSHDRQTQLPRIRINNYNKPRQGLNTCGSNSIFFFNSCKNVSSELYILNDKFYLPKEYIFPLVTGKNFVDGNNAYKWVLVPYDRASGKPLSKGQLSAIPQLNEYLCLHKAQLNARKGRMIGAFIKKGIWWAMLGVGKYSFYPFKIIWEAYGKHNFVPKIFDGQWQANQSLQAFIPCKSIKEAQIIYEQLSHPKVEQFLTSFAMAGSMNWAQPGKMSHLFEIISSKSEQAHLL